MVKKLFVVACVALVFCFILSGISRAAEKQTAKSFWQKLFNYPANVANETASVVADTATSATKVAANEIKTVGQVTSGEVGKTKNLVTDPLVGAGETTKKAIEGTVAVPVKANKEEQK